ncbi:MAG: DUF222 domain-containing protein [Actinomycetes bacterium]
MTTTPVTPIDVQVRALLASMVPIDHRTNGELCESLAALEQVVNSAQAEQAQVMAEMGCRATAADAADAAAFGGVLMPHQARSEFVADDIAVTLRCTKMVAATRYGLALATAEQPAVLAGWKTGQLDARKAQVICDGLVDVSSPAVEDLAAEAADYANTHTAPEVRRWLARRVIAADPAMAEIRRSRAVADRKVMLTPLPDGVSELSALLPSVQARQVYDTVNALAMNAGTDDVRTMDQRRADALIDLLVGRADPPRVQIQVTVPADALLGETAEPGHLAGIGPITSTEALHLAGITTGPSPIGRSPIGGGPAFETGDRVFRRLLTDPDTGTLTDIAETQYRPSARLDRAIRARDGVCRFPGCNRSAHTTRSGTDLDHTIPWPRGKTTPANLAVLCRHHHRLKHSPNWNAHLEPDGTMRWTTPTGATLTTYPWAYAEAAQPFDTT